MFKQLDYVKMAESSAMVHVMEERNKFLPYLEIAENFAKKEKLIFGGNAGLDILLGNEPTVESFELTLYSNDILNHSRRLAMEFYKKYPEKAKLTKVRTLIPYQKLMISINSRTIVIMKSISPHRNSRLGNIIVSQTGQGLFTKHIQKCLGPDLILINIYNQLIDTNYSNSWSKLVEVEQKLYNILQSHKVEITKSHNKKSFKGGGEKDNTKQIYYKFMNDVMDNFVSQPNNVVILPCKEKNNQLLRIKITSDDSFENCEKKIRRIAKKYTLQIHKNVNDMSIPIDRCIKKLTLCFFNVKTMKKQAFMDIYNTAQYTAIPYVTNKESLIPISNVTISPNIKVGTPYVLLKFILVEMWTIRTLLNANAIDKILCSNLFNNLFNSYSNIHDIIMEIIHNGNLELIFQSDINSYIGQYLDENIMSRRQMHDLQDKDPNYRKPYPYYPICATKKI